MAASLARPCLSNCISYSRPSSRCLRSDLRVRAATKSVFAPPPVAETKRKFLEKYRKPIPAIYNGVLQELLVQHHFMRYNISYSYDEVFALGFVSVFEQLLDGFDEQEKTKIFAAYIECLQEKPEAYKRDASALEELAQKLSGPKELTATADGTEIQKTLSKIAANVSSGKFYYTKFFAIGLFRLLEITGAKEPAALEKLVSGLGVRLDAVNKDLMLYKGVLSKLSAAKELMRDFMERERKKQAERESEKKAKADAEKEAAGTTVKA